MAGGRYISAFDGVLRATGIGKKKVLDLQDFKHQALIEIDVTVTSSPPQIYSRLRRQRCNTQSASGAPPLPLHAGHPLPWRLCRLMSQSHFRELFHRAIAG